MQNRMMGPTEWALLGVLSVLWGGSFFFVEVALAELGPLTVVLSRVGLAAVALVAVVYLAGHRMPHDWRTWGVFVVMGGVNNLIPFSLIAWGQVHIDSGLAAILNATTPLFTVLLAHLLTTDERLTPNRVAGVVLGLAGVVVLIGPEALAGLGLQGLGQAAVLVAAASYALAGIYGRRLKALPTSVAAAGMLTATTVMMLPLALIVERPFAVLPGPVTGAAIVGLALLSTAMAYLIYFRVLAVAGATNLLLVTFLIPVSALLLGVLVLGEQPGWTAVAGMALIFLGLAAVDGRPVAALRRPVGAAAAAAGRGKRRPGR